MSWHSEHILENNHASGLGTLNILTQIELMTKHKNCKYLFLMRASLL